LQLQLFSVITKIVADTTIVNATKIKFQLKPDWRILMKRFILASLTALSLSSTNIGIVKAEPMALNPYNYNQTYVTAITPFELVSTARTGQFTNQGIPSYSAFITAYVEGKVTAEDLIQAAIQTKRLPAEIVNDTGYLNNVKSLLQSIDKTY